MTQKSNSISPSGLPAGLQHVRGSLAGGAIEGAEASRGQRLRLACVIVGLVIALGMGACGDDDEESGRSGTVTEIGGDTTTGGEPANGGNGGEPDPSEPLEPPEPEPTATTPPPPRTNADEDTLTPP